MAVSEYIGAIGGSLLALVAMCAVVSKLLLLFGDGEEESDDEESQSQQQQQQQQRSQEPEVPEHSEEAEEPIAPPQPPLEPLRPQHPPQQPAQQPAQQPSQEIETDTRVNANSQLNLHVSSALPPHAVSQESTLGQVIGAPPKDELAVCSSRRSRLPPLEAGGVGAGLLIGPPVLGRALSCRGQYDTPPSRISLPARVAPSKMPVTVEVSNPQGDGTHSSMSTATPAAGGCIGSNHDETALVNETMPADADAKLSVLTTVPRFAVEPSLRNAARASRRGGAPPPS